MQTLNRIASLSVSSSLGCYSLVLFFKDGQDAPSLLSCQINAEIKRIMRLCREPGAVGGLASDLCQQVDS